jgi:hypothetical protein
MTSLILAVQLLDLIPTVLVTLWRWWSPRDVTTCAEDISRRLQLVGTTTVTVLVRPRWRFSLSLAVL